MNCLPVLPIITSIFIAILCCICWSYPKLQKTVHILGSILLLVVILYVDYSVVQHGILVVQVGNYKAPFGISIVIDDLSAIMLTVTGIITICVSTYALVDINLRRQQLGFYPVYWVLVTGICGAFSTGDMFNLYVWFEVMLIASFVLMALGNSKAQLDGTMKYIAMNLIATILMLAAIAMLYGITGTLNMADLANRLSHLNHSGLVTLVSLLLVIAFSIKAALFPLFFWLPASYHTTSVSASAIFAGMLTKVGVYALIRLTVLIVPDNHLILTVLLISAALTMLTGVFGAASQFKFRRILSFHIISQIGYMIMGLAIYTPLALAGTIFYIVHHIIVKTNLFLISGITQRLGKSADIRNLGNFYRDHVYLSLLFFIPAFSLAGFPPLSGFWAKFILLKAAFISGNFIVAIIALVVSFITLYSMIKVWNHVFWKEPPPTKTLTNPVLITLNEKICLYLPVIILAGLTTIMGLLPALFFRVSMNSANQLFNRSQYIHAVMGKNER